jgi:hypothetical protein
LFRALCDYMRVLLYGDLFTRPIHRAPLAGSREETGGYQVGRSGDEVDDSHGSQTDDYHETQMA